MTVPFTMLPNEAIDQLDPASLWALAKVIRSRNFETGEITLGMRALMRETGFGNNRCRRILKMAAEFLNPLTHPVTHLRPTFDPPKSTETAGLETGPTHDRPTFDPPSDPHTKSFNNKKKNTTLPPLGAGGVPTSTNLELLEAFWRVKTGSKSDAAWTRLLRNLHKIHEAGGDVNDQLGMAESAKWKGIEFTNWKKYASSNGNGSRPQTPSQSAHEHFRKQAIAAINSASPDDPERDVPF